MTLTADLRSVWFSLHELRDMVLPLRLLVNEDIPESPAPQPVQALGDRLDDVFGRLQEAIDALGPVLDDQSNEPVRSALARTHRAMLDFAHEWSAEISAHHRLAPVTRSAVERGPAWRVWAKSTVENVQGCETVRHRVDLNLLACWQTLAEIADQPPRPSYATKEL
ncbi:hypothetical protein [Mycolicibacterium vaccae]|uniref:hypothetical protein n=1 Tax=Mycolicibacterium vaccae TaxID=1810 RepID=UPI003D0352E7